MSTVILAHGGFLDGEAKTAEALIRYGQTPILAVIDEDANGDDAGTIVPGAGDGIPVVATMKDALQRKPDEVIIGIAPVGGRLPGAWRDELETALRAGVDVVAGLHDHLAQDERLAHAAREGGARIQDVRKPPAEKPIFSAQILDADVHVVLTVGTDCSSGKMTTSVELVNALRNRGIDTAFVATGQTGLLLGAEAGLVIDAVPSDFVAGWTEKLVLDAFTTHKPDVVVVEGQGALSHPAYAGVSLGLLHGAAPHQCILCHDASRTYKGASFANDRRFPVLEPAQEWGLIQDLASVVREPELAGISVMNGPLSFDPDGPLGKAPVADVLYEGADAFADQVADHA